jgi:hypothetical protein
LLPPSITVFVFVALAAARVLFLVHESLIDAIAELISDVRRNGLTVIKTVLGWTAAIAALLGVIAIFQIPF